MSAAETARHTQSPQGKAQPRQRAMSCHHFVVRAAETALNTTKCSHTDLSRWSMIFSFFGVLVLLLADRWRHPRGPERAPRSMGIIFFQENERHAAWERSWPATGATKCSRSHPRAAWESFFFKKTNATLHGSAPAAQGRPRSPKTKK